MSVSHSASLNSALTDIILFIRLHSLLYPFIFPHYCWCSPPSSSSSFVPVIPSLEAPYPLWRPHTLFGGPIPSSEAQSLNHQTINLKIYQAINLTPSWKGKRQNTSPSKALHAKISLAQYDYPCRRPPKDKIDLLVLI